LFRSAAAAYGSQVIGVILSGYLDDGTAGMVAIQRCGGVTVVLDPADTLYGDMSKSVLSRINVDHKLRLAEIGSMLNRLAAEPAQDDIEIPEEVIREAQFAERVMSDIKTEERLGELVPMSCPECGGPLWEINVDQVKRYRCHVGHAFTEWALLVDQDESIEHALWMAMRTMEERANLLTKMADTERDAGRGRTERNFREHSEESRTHANAIRNLIMRKG
jgi:two-component system chemotaxis response regulator CheB